MSIKDVIATTSQGGSQRGSLWKEFLQQYPAIASKQIRILFDSNMAAPLRMVIEHSNHLADVEHIQPDVAVVLRQNHFLSDYGFSAMPSFANAQLPLLYCNCNSSATYNQYVTVLTTICMGVCKKSVIDTPYRDLHSPAN